MIGFGRSRCPRPLLLPPLKLLSRSGGIQPAGLLSSGGQNLYAHGMPSLQLTPEPPPGSRHADWREWYDRCRTRFELELSAHLNLLKNRQVAYTRLFEAVEYSLLSGGKRLRPVLLLESSRICGGIEAAAMPAALAIECIHTFSLIHDDLPALDNDDLRRGKPTTHKVFGEALALLAGDWLQCHAFELLPAESNEPACSQSSRELANACADMILGQAADVEGERRPSEAQLVRFIHRHKTARLIEAACRLGTLSAVATAQQRDLLTEYGRHLGLAFQIRDDLLDLDGTTESLGKRPGKDEALSKQTYPAAFGLEESRRMLQAEIESAIVALAPFGSIADRLRELAQYVGTRDR